MPGSASALKFLPAVEAPTPEGFSRVTSRGKHLYAGDEKFYVRGVTYGAFRPGPDGSDFPDPEVVASDFARMAQNGFNAVRLYTLPPRSILELARRHGLRVMVGFVAESYLGLVMDGSGTRRIEAELRTRVREIAGHPALLLYSLGNEIPASTVRYVGRRRIERFLARLYRLVKSEDPEGLVTYANYPTSEYLELPFLDVVSFNVYLEEQEQYEAYLARLHNLAGDRPLLMSELGLDSIRNGEVRQAAVLDWQVRTSFRSGCAGAFVYSWTDEWYSSGRDVVDWEFGLTHRDRSPKPALAAVREAFERVPFCSTTTWPRMSVVVCTHNGARTLRGCLAGVQRLDYPDFEVIVVDDGSTDASAEIVGDFPVRLIRTPNRGLSAARNTGLGAATGDIVAYLDDDAYPDPHWLRDLATGFADSEHAAIGGPNIPPEGDGVIADCVANAPGGPVHVLLTDSVAEHIPGCNMAFRREHLLEIGGFDPTFRVAGDDVDVCWRLQKRGWTIGFRPSAVVWHHRRNSILTYWRQQRGYGRAEALLERKWPEKYNGAGHVSWSGRVYGTGLVRALTWRTGRIYQGVWGNAPFQSLYTPATGFFSSLPLMPEWYLVVAALLSLTGLGLLWNPLLWALPLLLLSSAAVLAQAVRSAAGARFASSPKTRIEQIYRYGVTTLLHLLQPAARLGGRWTHGLTPWRRGRWIVTEPGSWALPRSRVRRIWSASWLEREAQLESLERILQAAGGTVRRSGDFDGWDLEVVSGGMGVSRLILAAEYADGGQILRIRSWPVFSRLQLSLLTATGGLAALAALAGAVPVALILGLAALGVATVNLLEAGAAAGAVQTALGRLANSAEEYTDLG